MHFPSGTTHECVRVLVADSSQTLSQVVCRALRQHQGMTVTNCPCELSHCLEALRAVPADVVLLTDDPSNHGHLVETLRVLHGSYPQVRIVLALDCYDRDLVVSAVYTGATGVFCRACQPFRSLCRCISVVHQGQFWLNTEQMAYVIDALRLTPCARVVNAKGESLLTVREEQIASRVVEGISNREIGHQLGIKESSVKKALLRIYEKLGISNKVELVLYSLTHRQLPSVPTTANSLPGRTSGTLCADSRQRPFDGDRECVAKAAQMPTLNH